MLSNYVRSKKKLKLLNFEPIDIYNPIFIVDSLCGYSRKLWAKCKRIWMKNYIRGFWVSYELIKIKVSVMMIIGRYMHTHTFNGP